jgi:hypothetical protein
MNNQSCISAPSAPPNASSDWSYAVLGNCFQNIERLGQWIGGTAPVEPGASPSGNFQAVTADSLGNGTNPPTIYVLIHGWAPGYKSVVQAQEGNLLWWSSEAYIVNGGTNTWTSDWAWSAVSVPISSPFTVNSTGLLQSIKAYDPSAEILAYSWIDDSATPSGDLNLDEVYISEAYTHSNGLRLADALLTAINQSFWTSGGKLRLIGHSHGSKVATVAAFTLQQLQLNAQTLTILDAPENQDDTLEHEAANMLGFYLQKMIIADPTSDNGTGTFVDNYVSCFGVGYAGLDNVVEVVLDPKTLYGNLPEDWSNEHSYAAAWYGGSYAGSISQDLSPLGFAMPPVPSNYQPAFGQYFPDYPWDSPTQQEQWTLQPGQSQSFGAYSYTAQAMTVRKETTYGNMMVLENQGTGATESVSFGVLKSGQPAMYQGNYDISLDSDVYGIAVDIQWSSPQDGDYLVICSGTNFDGARYVLFVMDGQSAVSPLTTSVVMNCDDRGIDGTANIYIFYIPASKKSSGKLTISNFQSVTVGGLDSDLSPKGESESLKK